MLEHDLVLSTAIARIGAGAKKRADVARHPRVLNHVGLLVNGPPGIHRAALHLVVRQLNRVTHRSQSFKFADAPRDYIHYRAPIGKVNLESAWNVVGNLIRRGGSSADCT
jgi:hypothetical protein